MSTHNDGGPYHPTTQQIDGNGEVVMYADRGASLRDHFAGLAMQGMIAEGARIPITDEMLGLSLAKIAYALADAMLAARENRND